MHSEDEVRAAVARAREAAAWWSALSYDERAERLNAWKGVITRRIAQLADVMHHEMGKPHADAVLEAALAIDHLAWAAGPRREGAQAAQGVGRPGDVQPGGDRRATARSAWSA